MPWWAGSYFEDRDYFPLVRRRTHTQTNDVAHEVNADKFLTACGIDSAKPCAHKGHGRGNRIGAFDMLVSWNGNGAPYGYCPSQSRRTVSTLFRSRVLNCKGLEGYLRSGLVRSCLGIAIRASLLRARRMACAIFSTLNWLM